MASFRARQVRERRSPTTGCAVFLLLSAALLSNGFSADWPAYRHDLGRTSITEDPLTLPLRPAWRFIAPQPPQPAWSEPIRPPNRMDFDYAAAPVIANGVLYFGSSADDSVRAFDAGSGVEHWRFITGGPVRFAPQAVGDRLYFASDDGYVYCLRAVSGEQIWRFRAAPNDEQLIGNGRMISRWPVRTGVLVADDVVYCVAGMWSTEGIYVYALDAQTGKVIWCNDTSGFVGKSVGDRWRPNDPHSGEFDMTGLTPQGALLTSPDTLVVPLANNMPASFSRKTGELISYFANSGGSTGVTMDGDMYYTMLKGKGPLTFFGRRVLERKGAKAGKVMNFPPSEVPQISISPSPDPSVIHARGKVSAIVHNGKLIARHAYGLALAGDILLTGQDGAIVALDATTSRELWRAPVDGEAREIAVADGRLFVSTHRGEISCFVSATRPEAAVQVHDPAAAMRNPMRVAAGDVTQQIRQAGMDRGFALVAGDPDGRLSVGLAQNTQLKIVNVLTDERSVASLRARLLSQTTLYGSRISVQRVESLDRLPFAQYFANAIVVAGPISDAFAKELHRTLRPCGGVWLFPGRKAAEAAAIARAAGAAEAEIHDVESGLFVQRGRLPGARDWDTGPAPDHRARWPMRPIWFGGPASTLTMYTGIGQHPPVAANGRYFVMGNDTISAVDAYNGVVQWTRPIPTIAPHLYVLDGVRYSIADSPKVESRQMMTVLQRTLGADADHVYLTLADTYFREKGPACIQISARTGEQERMYAPFQAAARITAGSPRSWPLDIDATHGGVLTMQTRTDGLALTLTTRDPVVSNLDAWDLFFDFRPADRRYGLYDPGVFAIRVAPARDNKTSATWLPSGGQPVPTPTVAGTWKPEGTTTTVMLPWAEIEKITGTKPSSFGFAATLNSHDGGVRESIVQRRLFSDAFAGGINNGWATVALSDSPAAAGSDIPPAVIAGPLAAMPKDWARPGAVNPSGIDDPIRLEPRTHPLTGELVPKIYRSGTAGCGRPVFSDTAIFGRSTKQAMAIYDFEDDSGLRFFGGTSANCGVGIKSINMNAALGLLIFSEARSHCDCMVPIRTSLAFAPAERRLNEDWAIFCDRDVDTLVRQAAVNFGAFGDRRDAQGALWLGFPRPGTGSVYPQAPGSRQYLVNDPPVSGALQVPLVLQRTKGFGPYRENSDRVTIQGTDRPWIYASGYQGIEKATLQLNFLKPLESVACQSPPTMDGVVNGSEWGDQPPVTLPMTKTQVFLRHDAANLYIAAKRPSVVNRLGKVVPWIRRASGEDANVFDDDSWEVFLSDNRNSHVLHLAVSASGARFDALGRGRSEKPAWSADWKSAVTADDNAFAVELAIPWQTLTAAELQRDQLTINFQMNQQETSAAAPSYPGSEGLVNIDEAVEEPLVFLGLDGRGRCENFVPLGLGARPKLAPRWFTVRLHFAELDDIAPGQRVFDVKLQGQTALKDFDIVREAGGTHRAVVKEFPHVSADETLTLEFVPAKLPVTLKTVPILSGLELFDEEFRARTAAAANHR